MASKKPPLGSGKRFKNLTSELAQNPKIRNPRAVAAKIEIKKYGQKRTTEMASRGRKRAEHMMPGMPMHKGKK